MLWNENGGQFYSSLPMPGTNVPNILWFELDKSYGLLLLMAYQGNLPQIIRKTGIIHMWGMECLSHMRRDNLNKVGEKKH